MKNQCSMGRKEIEPDVRMVPASQLVGLSKLISVLELGKLQGARDVEVKFEFVVKVFPGGDGPLTCLGCAITEW